MNQSLEGESSSVIMEWDLSIMTSFGTYGINETEEYFTNCLESYYPSCLLLINMRVSGFRILLVKKWTNLSTGPKGIVGTFAITGRNDDGALVQVRSSSQDAANIRVRIVHDGSVERICKENSPIYSSRMNELN